MPRMSVSWAAVPLRLLLVIVGALLVGVRAYRSTAPARNTGDEESRQLFRFASAASFGLFLLMLAVVAMFGLKFFHVARTMW